MNASDRLPRLRRDLDIFPSPMEERPGLLLRDPYQYTSAMAVIPPALVPCLALFDGEHRRADLSEALYRLTERLDLAPVVDHLISTLGEAGFLEDDHFLTMREVRHAEFAGSPIRTAVHVGEELPDEIRGWLGGGEAAPADQVPGAAIAGAGRPGRAAPSAPVRAIAAPHASPEAAWETYRAAYRALPADGAEQTFVILGTSHYGPPERFGVTAKRFVTPFGQATTDSDRLQRLIADAGDGLLVEDYHHAIEHSIEFQVVFLQHLYGPGVRILPILCGPFARSLTEGGAPEADDRVAQVIDALGNMAARDGDRLAWVLGIDMAHIGQRYGDPFEAQAGDEKMVAIEARDRARLERVLAGDVGGFWDLVQPEQDPLKWCGSSPLYTFLKARPELRGELLRYDQWNIDGASVVSFAGLSFR